mmetsp:Transcript_44854/g.118524  ORF Transcript_44854/g.118524 Transcript_44854/m.118524 type:complete len:247 (+) Transcript_44854:1734-2474(+)
MAFGSSSSATRSLAFLVALAPMASATLRVSKSQITCVRMWVLTFPFFFGFASLGFSFSFGFLGLLLLPHLLFLTGSSGSSISSSNSSCSGASSSGAADLGPGSMKGLNPPSSAMFSSMPGVFLRIPFSSRTFSTCQPSLPCFLPKSPQLSLPRFGRRHPQQMLETHSQMQSHFFMNCSRTQQKLQQQMMGATKAKNITRIICDWQVSVVLASPSGHVKVTLFGIGGAMVMLILMWQFQSSSVTGAT